jgi:hypothetical protein
MKTGGREVEETEHFPAVMWSDRNVPNELGNLDKISKQSVEVLPGFILLLVKCKRAELN